MRHYVKDLCLRKFCFLSSSGALLKIVVQFTQCLSWSSTSSASVLRLKCPFRGLGGPAARFSDSAKPRSRGHWLPGLGRVWSGRSVKKPITGRSFIVDTAIASPCDIGYRQLAPLSFLISPLRHVTADIILAVIFVDECILIPLIKSLNHDM